MYTMIKTSQNLTITFKKPNTRPLKTAKLAALHYLCLEWKLCIAQNGDKKKKNNLMLGVSKSHGLFLASTACWEKI